MKLEAKRRVIVGKKVKNLRSESSVPASIYGPKKQSENIQVETKKFAEVFKKVGFNKFFDLAIEEDKPVKVLVKDVQIHPVKDNFLSISFYQISEDTKLTVEVPIILVGESPAVTLNLGFLVQAMDNLKINCLPKDIPASFEIDINGLANTGDSISVATINLGEGVELDSSVDATSALVYIAAKQKEEEVVVAPVEGEEGAEGAVEGIAEGAESTEEKAE